MRDPFELLGLPSTASESEVRQQWRTLLHTKHPDVGGNTVEFIELRQAYSEALSAAHNRKCPRCGGTGYEQVGAGGVQLRVRCGGCNG